MKKVILLFIIYCLCMNKASAYDFSAEHKGKVIYYSITSKTKPYTAEVTFETENYKSYSDNVKIPENVVNAGETYAVTAIGNRAFFESTNLTSITIPNSVTAIGDGAFENCYRLISVTIPNSITTLGDNAFNGCIGLTYVNIPNSVTAIGNRAFYVCHSLTGINVDAGNAHFSSLNGVLFNKLQDTLIKYPADKPENTYTIPNSVTTIETEAFVHCGNITFMTFPNSIRTIRGGAFANCYSLTSVTIPNSVRIIEAGVFNGTALTSVIVPDSITSIKNGVFHGCKNLTEITFGKWIMSIGNNAFSRCPVLTSITIPNKVMTIGEKAFFQSGLTSVTIPPAVRIIGELAFGRCKDLTEIHVKALKPPRLGDDVFEQIDKNIPVHVPHGKAEAYAGWGGFTNIIDDI